MPNHTDNLLSIVGRNKIKSILKPYLSRNKVDGSFLDFNKIVPMPDCILESLKFGDCKQILKKRTEKQKDAWKLLENENKIKCLNETGVDGWYEWSIQNWGTKWNSYNNRFYKKDGCECLFFQTAWSVPENALRTLAMISGETFRLAYLDEGYAFMGVQHFFNDGRVDDEYYDDVKMLPSDLKIELGITDDEEEQEEMEEQMMQVKAGQNK